MNYKLCADWDFNLRCYSKSGFTYTDKIIAKFHGGGLTTSSDQDAEFSRDFVNNIIKYFKISLFNPAINSALFHRFNEVLVLQKKTNYLKYILNRLKIKFF